MSYLVIVGKESTLGAAESIYANATTEVKCSSEPTYAG